ncbi:MAG TPA: hypothetical protein VHQ22_22715 [Terriglobales bacterium]|nr:hypothetical protein [Terriglobales bacterium]
MSAIFSSQRFGRPQIFAAALLLVFIGECAWLVAHEYPNATGQGELGRIEEGLAQWHGVGIAGTPTVRTSLGPVPGASELYDPHHSPLWSLIAAAPLAIFHVPADSLPWLWLTRAPYILFGTLLGASLWYVARRLYGNAGGYIALTLYCFSPAVIRSGTLWVAEPDIAGAWGTFGAVFTAIAVAHTLYAPREVVLWNWRRILLLAVSLTLAVGSQFGLAIVIPVLLAFMLYLAPDRKRAAAVILVSACLIAGLLLFASYFFHPALFLRGLKHSGFLDANWRAMSMPGAYKQLLKEIAGSGPVLLLLFPAALVIFLAWPRTRYFGNAAPLLMAVLFLLQRVLSPHAAGSVFSLTAVVFVFVFVSGIVSDLLETKSLESVSAVLVGLVAANALWDLVGLSRIGH